ncbi:MAG: ribosomal protein S18-alanine N-acetyltransferase, partial [Deltaproteobacteria bacterium]|nr:ribosomal protein S18-alanine N-acetyltransferase [Deltaproteobacteria bacterium]
MPVTAMQAYGLSARAARREDLDALAEIVRSDPATSWDRAALAAELSIAWSRMQVLERAGQVLAFVVYWLVAGEIQLLHIATHAAHRRQGHACTLLRGLALEARQQGAQHILLEVRRGNTAARRLYDALGFRETGVRRRYYLDGEDAML